MPHIQRVPLASPRQVAEEPLQIRRLADDDLMKQKLQQAIYSVAASVVEKMIMRLDLSAEGDGCMWPMIS